MILALATVKRPSEMYLLWITPKVMQITEDSVTFQPLFGVKNARPSQATVWADYNSEVSRG